MAVHASYLYDGADKIGASVFVHTPRENYDPPPAPYFPRDQGKYKFKQLRPFQTRSTTANTVRRVNFVPFRIIGIPARTNKR